MPLENLAVLSLDEQRKVRLKRGLPWQEGQPLCILAHGAGNDVSSEFFQLLDDGLARFPLNRLYVNFPYRVAGKKMPDRLPVLQESWRRVITWVQEAYPDLPLVIGGKSMGGRVAATIAPEFPELAGIIFLGYPLHPPGKPDRLRDEPLYRLTLPQLFVQGTRDNLAKFDLIQSVIERIGDLATLVVVEGGDHSFKVPKKLRKTYSEVLYWVAEQIEHWLVHRVFKAKR